MPSIDDVIPDDATTRAALVADVTAACLRHGIDPAPLADFLRRRKPTALKAYDPRFAQIAHAACTQWGATRRELSRLFGVTENRIDIWSVSYPDFAAAVEVGRDAATDRVERALYERAVGYEYAEEKLFVQAGSRKPIRAHAKRHVPADVGAAIRWMEQHKPDRWQRTVGVVQRAPETVPDELTDADVAYILAIGAHAP